jgi:hypothetical protein
VRPWSFSRHASSSDLEGETFLALIWALRQMGMEGVQRERLLELMSARLAWREKMRSKREESKGESWWRTWRGRMASWWR